MYPLPHGTSGSPLCGPASLALAALLVLGGGPARQALAEAGTPVSLQLETRTDPSGTHITLTFSDRVEYRLEESRFRLTLLIDGPIQDDGSLEDRSVDGGALRRIRFVNSEERTELIFHLGREFETFSIAELASPFRVVLQFQRKGAPRPAGTGAQTGQDEGAGTSGPGASPSSSDQQGPAGGSVPGASDGARVVVLDPGHGGGEVGAVGTGGLKEKDLVLDVAARLRTRLRGSGFAVLMTREEDAVLDLTRRTAAANHAKAALFVSIHANASVRRGARGAETYFLSYGSVADEEAMRLANMENRPPGASSDTGEEAGGEIRMVLWEMAQADHLSMSSRLADLIQAEMNALGETQDRGVKQAPFRVLVGAAMPAVLVEVGFLSNPDEEKKLATEQYRDQIAGALANAIEKFERERGWQGAGGAGGAGATLSGGMPR